VKNAKLEVVDHELQQHAIGCYSAHSEIKRLNRKVEHALLVAERMTVLAQLYSGLSSPVEEFTHAWKNVCFGQFHDLLGGVAIKEAMDEAVAMYYEALSIAERGTRLAVQRIASSVDSSFEGAETVLVMNPTAFDRDELVEIDIWHPQASERGEMLESLEILDLYGQAIQSQKVISSARIGGDRVKFIFPARAGAFGISPYRLLRLTKPSSEIRSIEANHPFLAPAIVINDPSDTWAHGVKAFTDVIGEMDRVETELIESGPLRSCIMQSHRWGSSSMIEEIYEQASSDEIEIRLRINWQEERKILKYRIAHGAKHPHAFYEIPYAVIERPAGINEYPGQSWVFVEDKAGTGIGVITDSKCSYSIDETYIKIILARSAIYAHHVPPHEMFPSGDQRYLDQGEQDIIIRIVRGQASWQAAQMSRRSMQLLEPLIVHAESAHEGAKMSGNSLSQISSPNILLSVLKRAEDGEGHIVRLVETVGVETDCHIGLPFLNASWRAQFTPFAIKTFRIDTSGKVTESNLIEV